MGVCAGRPWIAAMRRASLDRWCMTAPTLCTSDDRWRSRYLLLNQQMLNPAAQLRQRCQHLKARQGRASHGASRIARRAPALMLLATTASAHEALRKRGCSAEGRGQMPRRHLQASRVQTLLCNLNKWRHRRWRWLRRTSHCGTAAVKCLRSVEHASAGVSNLVLHRRDYYRGSGELKHSCKTSGALFRRFPRSCLEALAAPDRFKAHTTRSPSTCE